MVEETRSTLVLEVSKYFADEQKQHVNSNMTSYAHPTYHPLLWPLKIVATIKQKMHTNDEPLCCIFLLCFGSLLYSSCNDEKTAKTTSNKIPSIWKRPRYAVTNWKQNVGWIATTLSNRIEHLTRANSEPIALPPTCIGEGIVAVIKHLVLSGIRCPTLCVGTR